MTKAKITRREFIGGVTAAGLLTKTGFGESGPPAKIDRYALVSRHNPVMRKLEPLSPLSVGNGEFAFTCDVTGLQTFPEVYANGMPLCTMSQWGWHTKPMPDHLKGKELKLTDYETYGRKVGYMTTKTGQEELFDWLRENPLRLHLGQVGFEICKADGERAKAADLTHIEQKLDLWTGVIESSFRVEGIPVRVKTAAHPQKDAISVSTESALISTGRLIIRIDFPYGSQTMQAVDWANAEKHSSTYVGSGNYHQIERRLYNDRYVTQVTLGSPSEFSWQGLHSFHISAEKRTRLDATIFFAPKGNPLRETSKEVIAASSDHWKKFWQTGAAVEFSGSKDPRAKELERRVVLSQYLTAIQCSGSLPPQETGLTTNSWYGKYHLEMHWWHAAQFALWNRFPLLERSLDWYNKVLPSARERAKQQGYKGARWAKMTDPSGRDSPSPVGTLLIWQQPHPIFYAELAYLNKPTKATLEKYQSIVQETAEWMADYAHLDLAANRYVLGPPFIPAQENHPPRETWNATYELEYWRYGLKTANAWRVRLGLKREPRWDDIVAKLSNLPVKDGVYLAHENCPQTFTERNKDHPSMLAAFGILTGEMVDRETMRRTLKKVMKEWDWPETWGWDYPMTAMTAARLGEPAIAIDALLLDTPKNKYLPNGHNYQRPNLPLYLPGNGGLLYAIALMAAGWKGAPKTNAPGFPSDGSWTVRSEGFDHRIFSEI
jgi:protein-glucosylgalactosylhydroxylysine glucosidase